MPPKATEPVVPVKASILASFAVRSSVFLQVQQVVRRFGSPDRVGNRSNSALAEEPKTTVVKAKKGNQKAEAPACALST